MEAVGFTIGVVGFGLQLATTIQAYVEGVKGGSDRFSELALDVSSTTSVLKQLEDLIESDKTISESEGLANSDPTTTNSPSPGTMQSPGNQNVSRTVHGPVLSEQGRYEVETLSRRCEKVFNATVRILISAAAPPSDRTRVVMAHVGISELTVSKLYKAAAKAQWPWLEPRVKACEEQLRWLKMNLVLHLQVASLASIQMTPRDENQNDEEEAALIIMIKELVQQKSEFTANRVIPNPNQEKLNENNKTPSPVIRDRHGGEDLPHVENEPREQSSSTVSPKESATQINMQPEQAYHASPDENGSIQAATATASSGYKDHMGNPIEAVTTTNPNQFAQFLSEETGNPISAPVDTASPARPDETGGNSGPPSEVDGKDGKDSQQPRSIPFNNPFGGKRRKLIDFFKWRRSSGSEEQGISYAASTIEAWIIEGPVSEPGRIYPLPLTGDSFQQDVKEAMKTRRIPLWQQYLALNPTKRSWLDGAIRFIHTLDNNARTPILVLTQKSAGNSNDSRIILFVKVEEEESFFLIDWQGRRWTMPLRRFKLSPDPVETIFNWCLGYRPPATSLDMMLDTGEFVSVASLGSLQSGSTITVFTKACAFLQPSDLNQNTADLGIPPLPLQAPQIPSLTGRLHHTSLPEMPVPIKDNHGHQEYEWFSTDPAQPPVFSSGESGGRGSDTSQNQKAVKKSARVRFDGKSTMAKPELPLASSLHSLGRGEMEDLFGNQYDITTREANVEDVDELLAQWTNVGTRSEAIPNLTEAI